MALTMGAQLRAARALLRMEQADLAKQANVSVDTVRRIESFNGRFNATLRTIQDLTEALEKAGVNFTNGSRPGVTIDIARLER